MFPIEFGLRPDYKELRRLREKYPRVPLMALTATATPRVRLDVLHQLGMQRPKWFLSSFNRGNLQYVVLDKKGGKTVTKAIGEMILKDFRRQSGIIYCLSRKECDTVSEAMNEVGISSLAYHAGLGDGERSSVQDRWIRGSVLVVCATIAFGMGVDKPDVRFVIHFSLPKSIEGYYQVRITLIMVYNGHAIMDTYSPSYKLYKRCSMNLIREF